MGCKLRVYISLASPDHFLPRFDSPHPSAMYYYVNVLPNNSDPNLLLIFWITRLPLERDVISGQPLIAEAFFIHLELEHAKRLQRGLF